MAAKPPKPPGNFLNNNNNSDTNCSTSKTTPVNTSPPPENNNSVCNSYNLKNISNNNSDANGIVFNGTLAASPKPSCHCSNISIMHLFHEMKQEFPTIPDEIVAQCVNENCHQRENCILMLRKELALNPIPVQTYPSKVLQRQHQQQRLLHQQPPKPTSTTPTGSFKPIRPAPQQPPVPSSVSNSFANPSNPSVLNSDPTTKSVPSGGANCDSVSVTQNKSLLNSSIVDKKDVEISNSCVSQRSTRNASDMPTTTTPTIVNSVSENNCRHGGAQSSDACSPQQALQSYQHQLPQRVRPTTLDLNFPHQQQQQQQQLRRQLNVQLQQHFQQRQPTKPIRKAPLPPIPPKPAQLANNQHHSSNNTPTITPAIPQHSSNASLSSQQSYASEAITSPISSGESEISVNVSLSSPTTGSQHNQLKSPIRHRSVITVQPEPPYTRDFLISPTSSSGGSSQKSFTSVNLTLRQPSTTAPKSTIDISAGPGLSGVGSGLTYSSTSYDARRGCQKNFHITVTDEGGVFSASRLRPRTNYSIEQEQGNGSDGGGGVSGFGGVGLKPALHSPASEQNIVRQQQYQSNHRLQQQKEQQHTIVASTNQEGEMCFPRGSNSFKEILQRQRERRDKLSIALRDSKKRLSQVEQENNILTNPVSPGESERLDSEIQRLRCDCEAMWNKIENSKRCGSNFENIQGLDSMNNRQQLQQQTPQLQIPQPFPRQRPPRPPPPVISRQPPLDFVQHHISSPTSLTSPNQQPPPSYQQLQQQYFQEQHFLRQQQLQPSTDEEEYSDSNTDGGDEESEEGLEMWACNMCTFRNHPQLNICECCENVRILPDPVLSREDIHITLSPGENRIIHSWIVS